MRYCDLEGSRTQKIWFSQFVLIVENETVGGAAQRGRTFHTALPGELRDGRPGAARGEGRRRGAALHPEPLRGPGHGERSRLQLLFKSVGTAACTFSAVPLLLYHFFETLLGT